MNIEEYLQKQGYKIIISPKEYEQIQKEIEKMYSYINISKEDILIQFRYYKSDFQYIIVSCEKLNEEYKLKTEQFIFIDEKYLLIYKYNKSLVITANNFYKHAKPL